MIGLLALLILGGIVVGVIAMVRRVMEKRAGGPSDGSDMIAYLLLALSIGVAAFALAELGRAAFPGDSFVGDTSQRVATSLAGLVVATPIAVFLWRREAKRRLVYPRAAGWTVYLSLIEAVFMTSLVIAAYSILNWLLSDGRQPDWTDFLVFGGVVVFHEIATRRTPPRSDGSDLPRVIGSAIGLITTAIGLAGILYWLLQTLYSTLTATAGDPELGTWLAIFLVGAPVWLFSWWRPWPDVAGAPRNAWTFLMAVAGLSTAIGALAGIVLQTLDYLLADTSSAGQHFEFLPAALSIGIVGGLVWAHHRRRLGPERTDPVRAYEYSMAAIGLGFAIGAGTALTTMAFGPSDLIRPDADVVIAVATILGFALGVWAWFWSKATRAPREMEAGTTPRRFYLVGFAVVTGLVSAGALIGTLVVLFQRLLDSGGDDTLAIQASLFIFAGLATWHLLRVNAQDRDLIASDQVVTPFEVTLVCSHPGLIATGLPKEAKLAVIYRGDDVGIIDDAMASKIVEAVGHTSSLVWVDEDGFRVAPSR
jgi:hypothetical protein